MLVDEITLYLKAGDGGNGVVRWRHEKGKEFAGASGGNGGKGGDIFARGVRDIGLLAKYRSHKEFRATRGGDGMKQSMHGKNGAELVLDVPVGSVINNLQSGQNFQILEENQKIQLLRGGRGGLGNEHFKSSTNTTPWEFTKGMAGEEASFFIELELMVDAGLIGLPNAGKSSLLNAITEAAAKVASYPFTTLEPNLGDFFGYIIADIPGLIEGASKGKGLGHKFLRHIKRTKILLHCISLEDEDIEKNYKIIRNELHTYGENLTKKPEIIVFTKSDLVDRETLGVKESEAKKLNQRTFIVSILDDKSIKEFKDGLIKILRSNDVE